MAPDHPAAAAAAKSADNLQGDAVQSSTVASGETRGSPEITRRDVHITSSLNAQRRYLTSPAKEPNLAHQAALRRSSAKGKDIAQHSHTSSSTARSRPVLVRKPSVDKADMSKKNKTKIKTESPQMPPLERFSFQDILASIGPEGDASIDAIAEICGRSRMSLAEEHGSHRPPQVQLVATESSPAESVPSMRLETVEEADPSRPSTRSQSRSLALASGGEGVMSDPTAAASNVTSHAHTNISKTRKAQMLSESAATPLLSQILAWLRGSSTEAANTSVRDPRAARALQTMLSDSNSVRS